MIRRTILLLLTLGLTTTLSGSPALGTDEPGASVAEPVPPQAWLKATFGTVPGGPPDAPAAAAPDGQALGAWLRREPMQLLTDVPFEDLLAVTVTARALEDDAEEPLSRGATTFDGPDRVGSHVITAVLETEAYGETRLAWLVDVPRREGGTDALFDVPGPTGFLVSADGRVAGEPGHGCYAYMCREAGPRPPTESLAPLSAAVGEVLRLELDDGSAMSGWEGRVEPVDEASSGTVPTAVRFRDGPRATLELAGLEPTAAGEWLVELRLDYDRERGWQWFLFRLTVE